MGRCRGSGLPQGTLLKVIAEGQSMSDLALGPTVLTYNAMALRISRTSDGRGKSHKSVIDIGDGGTFTHQRHLWYTVYVISCK